MYFLVHLFELITAILATIYYKKYKNSSEKYFLHFLWFVFFIDFVLGGFFAFILEIDNTWVSIIYTFISFIFYFTWFKKILKRNLFKIIITYLCLIFILFAIYNFVTESWKDIQISTFVFGAIINCIAAILFFSELLASKEIIHLKYKLSFWIATGMLLFNLGMIPLIINSKSLSSNHDTFIIMLVSLNTILYTCYSVGFIWNKKENN